MSDTSNPTETREERMRRWRDRIDYLRSMDEPHYLLSRLIRTRADAEVAFDFLVAYAPTDTIAVEAEWVSRVILSPDPDDDLGAALDALRFPLEKATGAARSFLWLRAIEESDYYRQAQRQASAEVAG